MVNLNDFLYLYCLKPSTHHGYFEFHPWDRKSRVVRGFLSSFHDWKSRYLFIYGKEWETASDEVWGEVPKLPCTWKVPTLGAFFPSFDSFHLLSMCILLILILFFLQ